MKCLNPFCNFRGKKFKSERGLTCHLLNNKKCSFYMMFYQEQNNNTTEQNKSTLFNYKIGTDSELDSNKRLCTDNNAANQQYLNSAYNLTNFVSPEMQLLFDDIDSDLI